MPIWYRYYVLGVVSLEDILEEMRSSSVTNTLTTHTNILNFSTNIPLPRDAVRKRRTSDRPVSVHPSVCRSHSIVSKLLTTSSNFISLVAPSLCVLKKYSSGATQYQREKGTP